MLNMNGTRGVARSDPIGIDRMCSAGECADVLVCRYSENGSGSAADLIRLDPEQELGDHPGEVARSRMDEPQDESEAAIDVRLLCRDPAEVIETRRPAMFDDPVEVMDVDRGIVDVVDDWRGGA
ncbi:hypothetical protein GTK09_08865 [Jiella sp. 40Bstr34]|uniref:Uncharacterized protein n=1 Tax=Jiella pacifica TaxID=2696469 RepID=A0A6N9SZQ7_9HYPH|nr:hypothetical protein [Jiella pacifica]